MQIGAGTRLGPYEIVSRLGAGGMGEVWRAKDTRLDRSVAIKVLPESFERNDEFRARFEREAKAISSLNHPNICTLFDVGHENGTSFLVLELIEGEQLTDRLRNGPLPTEQLLRFGAQIADALARAHKQGIVHRDLKPGNVMLTRTGAKLLDFGLARSGAEASPIQGLSGTTAMAQPLTQEGTILGTFQYMAPEQLEGLEADARTDIFALGTLLYEMATGKRAFEGKSRTSLIAAIVSSQPAPISQLAPMAPAALDRVVRKCLEKDPEDRWQSAHDVATELRWIGEAGSEAVAVVPGMLRPRSRERLAWLAAGIAAAVAIAAGWALLERPEPARQVIESSIAPPANTRVRLDGGLSISPSGQTLVVSLGGHRSTNALWIRSLQSPEFRQLAGTEGAEHPFWSPDSRHVGFFAGGKLKTLDIASGSIQVVCDSPTARGASWSPDGKILLTPEPSALSSWCPQAAASPSSSRIFVTVTRAIAGRTSCPMAGSSSFLALTTTNPMICQASLDQPDVIKPIVSTSSSAAFVPPGTIVFARDSLVFGQAL
jgi:hypothetical protein